MEDYGEELLYSMLMTQINQTPKLDVKKIGPEFLRLLQENKLEEAIGLAEKEVKGTKKIDELLDKFVTQDSYMLKVKDRARQVANEPDPVLILGESGTGKELIAQALHGTRKGRFIAINCAGLPETLMESEMFGYVRGAFTGADKERSGILESANNGTVFLDEVGELPLQLQAKMLRAIQENEIRKVGSSDTIKLSCRFVFATHRDLQDMMRMHLFREDFYWRISTITLQITPLRTRKDDIALIIRSLVSEDDLHNRDAFIHEVLEKNGEFHGNVRRLQQYIRRKQLFDTIE